MTRYLLSLTVALTAASSFAADKPTGSPDILPDGAVLEEVWNKGDFTEGVAAGPDGKIYFSDIAFTPGNVGRVMKYDPATNEVTVHSPNSGQSNGLFFDAHGRLIACCGANGGKRAVVEIKPDGKVHVLYDTFHGKRFNSPNDLVIDREGNIWFSDPRYVGEEPRELDLMCVYRVEPTGTIRRVTDGKNITKPNGVNMSPDGKTLYVAETDNGSFDVTKTPETPPKMKMTLNAFVINRDGTLGKKTVLHDFGQETGTDGMSIDTKGNIYAAVRRDSRHGITVFSPKGKELAYIPTDDLPTNCSFGIGPEAHTLYITAGKGLFRIKLKSTGYHPTRK